MPGPECVTGFSRKSRLAMVNVPRGLAVVDRERCARDASLKIRAVLIAIALLPLMVACGGPTGTESGRAGPSTHTLSVLVSGGGSVRSSGGDRLWRDLHRDLARWTSLTLTATPSAGATFAGW